MTYETRLDLITHQVKNLALDTMITIGLDNGGGLHCMKVLGTSDSVLQLYLDTGSHNITEHVTVHIHDIVYIITYGKAL